MDQPSPTSRRAPRVSFGATTKILLLSGSVLIAALAIAMKLSQGANLQRGFFTPAWGVIALAVLFAASELMVVHVQVGRSAHTVSVVEATVVIALFHASPAIALAAQLAGCGAVLIIHRKQRATKVFFNLAMFALENQVAYAIFQNLQRATSAPNVPSVRSWPAAYAATGAFTLCGTVLVFAVIYLAEDELSITDLIKTIRISLITSALMASVGIAASTLLASRPPAALLLVIPIAGAYATNQMSLRERRRIEELEFLRNSSSKLFGNEAAEQTLWGVLEAARAEFRVEQVLYEYQEHASGEWMRVSFQRSNAPVVTRIGESSPAGWCPSSATLVLAGSELSDELRSEIDARSITTPAIVAPVRAGGAIEGVLMVSHPLTEVGTLGLDDVRLADMLAAQLSSAMEAGRLEQSVAELRSLESRLVFELQHDTLTGLLNRAAFVRRTRDIVSRSRNNRLNAVVFIDLDDFKPVNDTYGHGAGDELLQTIATRIEAAIRPNDLAARFGGDEFAVFLNPIENREEAAHAAHRILAAIRETALLGGSNRVTPGASLGVAVSVGSEDVDTILERADAAMFRAKRHGKGHVEVSDPTMDDAIRDAYELELDLSGAAERGELDLVFQSVHSFETTNVVAYECLLRWNHPTRGILLPDQFMPTGLRSDIQREVRRFVSHAAGEALRELATSGYAGPVSLNLSAGQALDATLLDDLTALLADGTLAAHDFLIEITETAYQRSADTMIRRAEDLRSAGVGLVLDDLGVDTLTFGLIERLKPAQVKLSRTLLGERHQRPGVVSFIRSITELGRTVGFEVVAKGIETLEDAQAAAQLGCSYGQGYHFSRPSTLAEVARQETASLDR